MSNARRVLHSAECLSVIKGHSSCRMGQVCVSLSLCVCVCNVNKQTHKQSNQVPAGSKFQFQFQIHQNSSNFFVLPLSRFKANTRRMRYIFVMV